jgi:hypothetical protein
LVTTTNLTLQGAALNADGTPTTILDGASSYYLFRFYNTSISGNINDLIFQNGYSNNYDGAIFLGSEFSGSITNTTFKYNKADKGGGCFVSRIFPA